RPAFAARAASALCSPTSVPECRKGNAAEGFLMDTPIYIAAYDQSKFGKLMDMKIPDIIANAVNGVCRRIGVSPSVIDVGSIGATCNFSLNEQGLLAGLMAEVPGLEAKSIKAVENACASGGVAVLSVIYKLKLGLGDVGIAVGYE